MKRHPTCNTLLFTLFSLVVCWSPAQALTQVATAVAIRGDVQAIDSAGVSRTLASKSAIYEKDTIKTGERGQAQLLFTDNSIISLGRQSEMKVEEYRWQADQKDGALKTKIKEGTFRVMGGALATSAPQNFITETPTATIGIRGSMYAGKVTARTLSVVFQGGKGIDVTNALGTVVITKPGFGTRAEVDKPLLPPVKFEQQDLMELNKSLEGPTAEPDEKEPPASAPAGEASAENASGGSETVTPGDEASADAAPADEPSPTGDSSAPPADTLSVDLSTSAPPAHASQPLLSTGAVFLEPAPAAIANLQTSVVSDTSQAGLATTIDQGTAGVVDSTVSGRYSFFRRDIDLSLPPPARFKSTSLNHTSGTVDAFIGSGQITGAISDGTKFGPYLISGYNPAAKSYSGFAQIPSDITFVDPILGAMPLKGTTFADQAGQFFYSTYSATIDGAAQDYLLASLLFAGIPSASTPVNRIDKFTGHLLYVVPGVYDANLESMQLVVNYYNKRLIGRSLSLDPNSPKNESAIFFGAVDSAGAASLTILGGGDPGFMSGDVTSAYGTGSALLYGDFHQGIAFVAAGNDYSLISNAQGNSWSVTGAGLRSPVSKIISPYPAPPIPFSGFVVGAADDTSTGRVSRLFMNSLANEFTMIADPTSGVVGGSITARDLISGSTGWLSNLTVGGTASRSAYVSQDQMVAILSGSNRTLRDYGNFLITAGPDAPSITNTGTQYLTWGVWEMAYTDPMDSSNDHLFSSQSFWVAGQKTDSVYMGANLLNHPIVGTYDGKAFGVRFDALGQNSSPLTNGATHLLINFNSATPSPVTGTISFDQAVLTINSAASTLTADGFPAFVSNVTASGIGAAPLSSAVNGAFYGPAAEAVGGNFSAKMASGIGYYGIFGGSR